MADMDKLMEFLQKEVPSNAGDLISSLNLCIENIDNIRELLRNKAIELQKYDKQTKLDESMKCTNANKMLLDLRDYLKGYMSFTDEEMLYENDEETGEKNENSNEEKDDDKKYLTDQTIPYPLSEKLANTKPCKFSFRKIPHDVSSYKVLWVKICEILYEKDNKRFENIAKMKKLSGRGIPYITYKNDEAVKGIKDVDKRFFPFLDTDILVYANMNIPQIIKIIEELLGMYKISLSSIKVYLKKDKNPKKGLPPVGKYLDKTFDYKTGIKINLKNDNGNQCAENSSDVSTGKRMYSYLQDYFQDTNLSYDIQKFLDKNWCKETFNISYPLLKEYDESKDLKEQTIPEGKTGAYYIQTPILHINNKSYIIYMQWSSKSLRSRVEKWIDENSIFMSAPIIVHDAIEEALPSKSKQKCIYYDFKKDLCGNVGNPLFNQSCENVLSCQYYSEKEVYITSKDRMKRNFCLCCGLQAKYEYLEVSYAQSKNLPTVTKKLQILRCNHCNKEFINVDLYKNYIKNKNPDYIDVKFTEFEK